MYSLRIYPGKNYSSFVDSNTSYADFLSIKNRALKTKTVAVLDSGKLVVSVDDEYYLQDTEKESFCKLRLKACFAVDSCDVQREKDMKQNIHSAYDIEAVERSNGRNKHFYFVRTGMYRRA